PLPQEASGKYLATLKSNEAAGAAKDGPKPGSPNKRPFIGSIISRGSSPTQPPPITPNGRDLARPLPIRDYAYTSSKEPGSSREPPETILWQPVLFAAGGTADVSLTLPAHAATYRIRVQGNAASGRLGAIQEMLECRQNADGPAK